MDSDSVSHTAEEHPNLSSTKRVLVIGRRQHFDRTRVLAGVFFPYADAIEVWSDENLGGRTVRWWGPWFYSSYRKAVTGRLESSVLEPADVEDVIARCRLLRVLDRDEAVRHAVAAFEAWSTILARGDYQAVLLLPVDSFVLDTLARAAQARGIPALYPVGTPFSGRVRFTVRGELLGAVDASPVDLQAFDRSMRTLVEPGFRPDWLIGTNSRVEMTTARRVLIDSLKRPAYALYRKIGRDPLSYSFAPRRYYRHRMIATPARALAVLEAERHARPALPRGYALIPLQFYPETTTDYWLPEREVIDHHQTVLRLASALGKLMPVVIKEHPAAAGRRPEWFIRALSAQPNVSFVPLLYPLGELVERASLVIGPGSTTMLQAMLKQVPTMFVGTPFYGAGGGVVLRSTSEPAALVGAAETAMAGGAVQPEAAKGVARRFFESTAVASLGRISSLGERSYQTSPAPAASTECLTLLDRALGRLRLDAGAGRAEYARSHDPA